MGRYLTCTDLFRLAIPKSLGPQEFEPGTVSTPVFTGTGPGTLEVAWPRDTYGGVRTTIGAGNSALDLAANRAGISVQVVVGGVFTTLLVSIAGSLITIRSATDGGGLATTTGALALGQILLTPSVMAVLQSAAATVGSDGTAILGAVGSTGLPFPAAVVKVSRAGIPGAGLRLALSLDAGSTWGPSVVVPAGGVVSTAGRELELCADPQLSTSTTIGSGNAALAFTPARAGVSVVVVVAGLSTLLSVGVVGSVITIYSATGGGGAATTTGSAALLELLGKLTAMALLTSVALGAGSDGTGMLVAVGSTPLLYGFVLNDQWAFSTTASPEISQHLAAAEDESDGYIPESLRLPLTATNQALRLHLSGLAAYSLMKLRGIDPKSQDFTLYRTGRTDGIDWLTKIATGQLVPTGLTETPPGVSFADLAPRIPIYNRDFPLPP